MDTFNSPKLELSQKPVNENCEWWRRNCNTITARRFRIHSIFRWWRWSQSKRKSTKLSKPSTILFCTIYAAVMEKWHFDLFKNREVASRAQCKTEDSTSARIWSLGLDQKRRRFICGTAHENIPQQIYRRKPYERWPRKEPQRQQSRILELDAWPRVWTTEVPKTLWIRRLMCGVFNTEKIVTRMTEAWLFSMPQTDLYGSRRMTHLSLTHIIYLQFWLFFKTWGTALQILSKLRKLSDMPGAFFAGADGRTIVWSSSTNLTGRINRLNRFEKLAVKISEKRYFNRNFGAELFESYWTMKKQTVLANLRGSAWRISL